MRVPYDAGDCSPCSCLALQDASCSSHDMHCASCSSHDMQRESSSSHEMHYASCLAITCIMYHVTAMTCSMHHVPAMTCIMHHVAELAWMLQGCCTADQTNKDTEQCSDAVKQTQPSQVVLRLLCHLVTALQADCSVTAYLTALVRNHCRYDKHQRSV